MKIRNIAFGYCYENGVIVINKREYIAIKEICQAYLDGKSLLQISEWLNERKIEYMPGVYGWNKARIMRIFDDERCLGNDKYPMIIDKDLHEELVKIKLRKSQEHGVDKKSDRIQITVPVRCPKCNGIMRRRQDIRAEILARWDCSKHNCKCVIVKKDETMIEEITEILNEIISNPEIITLAVERERESSLDLIRVNNEIARLCDSTQIDRAIVKEKMLEYLTIKYSEVDSSVSQAQKLKDIFIEAVPLKVFCPHLFERTVEEIKLYTDGKIGLVLNNKQEIQSGGNYASSS